MILKFLVHFNMYDLGRADAFGNTVLHLSVPGHGTARRRKFYFRLVGSRELITGGGQSALDVVLVYATQDVIHLFEAASIRRQKTSHFATAATSQNINCREEKFYAEEDWALTQRQGDELHNERARKLVYLGDQRRSKARNINIRV